MLGVVSLVLKATIAVGAVGYVANWVQDTYRHGRESHIEDHLNTLGFRDSLYGIQVDLEDHTLGVKCDKTDPLSPTLYMGIVAQGEDRVVAWLPSKTRYDAAGQLVELDHGFATPLFSRDQIEWFVDSVELAGWCTELGDPQLT